MGQETSKIQVKWECQMWHYCGEANLETYPSVPGGKFTWRIAEYGYATVTPRGFKVCPFCSLSLPQVAPTQIESE